MNNTTSTCKKSLAAMLLSAVIALAGCAAQNGNLTPAETRQLFKAFERGEAQLTCGVPCSGRYGYNRRELRVLHDHEQWSALASRVLAIGASKDQAYYYLGRAAEGLQHFKAADSYYRAAKALNAHTGGFLLDGLVFPRDIDERLAILETIRTTGLPSDPGETERLAEVPEPDPDSPFALRDTSDLAAMIRRRPTNERPMYGLIQDRTPRNATEKKFMEALHAADQRFIESVLAQGLTRQQASQERLRKAWGYLRTDNRTAAIKHFNQAWLLDPENGNSYYGFALITEMRNGNPVQTEGYYRLALSKPGYDASAHVDYGRFLGTLKRLDDALQQLDLALQRDPDANKARGHKAYIYYLQNNYTEACKWGLLAEQRGSEPEPGFIDEVCVQS